MYNRLKEFRKNLNITVEELSQNVDVKPRTIGGYERGEREPSFDYLRKLSSIYHLNLNWLLTGEGTMYGETPSAVSSFNYDTLEHITIMVENYLSDSCIVMPPKKKAKLLVILFKLYSDNVNNLTDDIIKSMCELTQNNV